MRALQRVHAAPHAPEEDGQIDGELAHPVRRLAGELALRQGVHVLDVHRIALDVAAVTVDAIPHGLHRVLELLVLHLHIRLGPAGERLPSARHCEAIALLDRELLLHHLLRADHARQDHRLIVLCQVGEAFALDRLLDLAEHRVLVDDGHARLVAVGEVVPMRERRRAHPARVLLFGHLKHIVDPARSALEVAGDVRHLTTIDLHAYKLPVGGRRGHLLQNFSQYGYDIRRN